MENHKILDHPHLIHGGNRSLLLQRARSLGWTGADATFIDASVNLNPLGPPPFLKEVLFHSYESLVAYPDPAYRELSALAAQYHQSSSEVDFVFGNGADELIFTLPRMLKKITGDRALLRNPSYGSYLEALELAGFSVQTEQNWDRVFCKFDDKLGDEPDIIWFGAPNNPDGELPQDYPDCIIKLAREHPKVFLVIDEAFIDFTQAPSLLNRGNVPNNVIVLRSLTKIYAVPGLRIGYGVLLKEMASLLRKELPNWPLNSLAEAFAKRVFTDSEIPEFINRTKQFTAKERTRLVECLSSRYELCPSTGNFFLLRPLGGNDKDGKALRDYCLSHGIALRDCGNFPGLGPSWSRLGLQNADDNDRLLKVLLDFAGVSKPELHIHHRVKRRARALMIQGCSSSVGKSVLVTALCRIMRNRGIDVAPYKAQNMSNNSAVTPDGGEIGRAQAVQAQACGLLPDVRMNPVLIKPEGDTCSQIILNGKAWGRRSARDYYADKAELIKHAQVAYDSLAHEHELIILEGAGSPGEINLKDGDFVNMQAARYAEADVYLVGDIDRGGVFASFIGHLATFDTEERRLLKGFIINKFRGDETLLAPAYEILRGYTSIPVVGCIPYFKDIIIPEEDEHRLLNYSYTRQEKAEDLKIGILELPHVSNYTDFEAFAVEPTVTLITVDKPDKIKEIDALIIPGTKTTIKDLEWLEQRGLAQTIQERGRDGMVVFGICGGCQILGTYIRDPKRIESACAVKKGLGLLPVETHFEPAKNLHYGIYEYCWPWNEESDELPAWEPLTGYEIHHGRTELQGPSDIGNEMAPSSAGPFVRAKDGTLLGYWQGTVMGTYLHGIFDNDQFRTRFINMLRRRKGLSPQKSIQAPTIDREIQKLAELVEQHCQIDVLLQNLGLL